MKLSLSLKNKKPSHTIHIRRIAPGGEEGICLAQGHYTQTKTHTHKHTRLKTVGGSEEGSPLSSHHDVCRPGRGGMEGLWPRVCVRVRVCVYTSVWCHCEFTERETQRMRARERGGKRER